MVRCLSEIANSDKDCFHLSKLSSSMISSMMNSVSEHVNKSYNSFIHRYSLSLGSISQTLLSYLIQLLVWYFLFHERLGKMMMMSKCCTTFFLSSLNKINFSGTSMASEYSCMQIVTIVCHFYLFSILTGILNTSLLTRTKS